jgi:hypothetical protein
MRAMIMSNLPAPPLLSCRIQLVTSGLADVGHKLTSPLRTASLLLALAIGIGAAAGARADEAFDRGFTRCLAYDLGDRIGLSMIVRATLAGRKPEQSEVKTVHRFAAGVIRRAQRLGLADAFSGDWTENISAKPVQIYSEGYQHMEAVGTALAARFGDPARTALELGFRVRGEIEIAAHAEDKSREAILAQQRRLAKEAGLDPSVLDDYDAAMRGNLPRDKRVQASENAYQAIRGQFDNAIFDNIEIRRLRLNVFEAANALALSALGAAHAADHSTVDRMFERARIYGRNAKVTVSGISINGLSFPELPAMTGQRIPDLVSVIHYLLNVIGEMDAVQLDELYGRRVAALMELGIKLNLSMILYAPGEGTGEALRSAIERAAGEAQLPTELWQPLIAAMQAGKDQESVKQQAIKTIEMITNYLEAQRAKS